MGGVANRYQLVPLPPVEFTCSDVATCAGKLTLTGKIPLKKSNKAKTETETETIGTAGFSIPPGRTASVEVALNGKGRALLGAAHGHLGAGCPNGSASRLMLATCLSHWVMALTSRLAGGLWRAPVPQGDLEVTRVSQAERSG